MRTYCPPHIREEVVYCWGVNHLLHQTAYDYFYLSLSRSLFSFLSLAPFPLPPPPSPPVPSPTPSCLKNTARIQRPNETTNAYTAVIRTCSSKQADCRTTQITHGVNGARSACGAHKAVLGPNAELEPPPFSELSGVIDAVLLSAPASTPEGQRGAEKSTHTACQEKSGAEQSAHSMS